MIKILYAIGKNNPKNVRSELNGLKRAGFFITIINQCDISQKELLKKTKELSASHDILIVSYSNEYPNKFIKSLKNVYTVHYTADDPYGSKVRSEPFVSSFDHSFSGAVMYNKKYSMTDMYKKWGAKMADWWPLGLYSSNDPKIKIKDILKDRKIDLLHIGNPQNKTSRLLKIYKAFPDMVLCGNSFGIKGLLRTWYHVLFRKKDWHEGINPFDPSLIKMFLFAKSVSEEEKNRLRKNAKICLNMHQSSGPVNTRLFEIPASGAMQVCDCIEGLGDVFKVGKEVIGYSSEEEAIGKIHYYLEHPEEGKKIARAGYDRVIRDYKNIDCWKVALEKVKTGMIKKGIKRFKDGTKICVNKKLLNKYKVN